MTTMDKYTFALSRVVAEQVEKTLRDMGMTIPIAEQLIAKDREIAELRAIVDPLPKDADGKAVVEGESYYMPDFPGSGQVYHGKAMMQWNDDDFYTPSATGFTKSYRTKAAAQRSLAKETDDGE